MASYMLDYTVMQKGKVNGKKGLASWLVHLSPNWAVHVQALAGDIVLCSLARHFTYLQPDIQKSTGQFNAGGNPVIG